MADCYTKEVIEIAWPRRCRVLTTYAAVVVITVSFLFPANARATDQDMQATTYTLAEIEKLARVPTIEEEMALLQPPENKIDLRVVKPQKIQEAIPLPRATATVTKELVEKKNSGGGVRAFSAVSSPQTNTGVAIINSGINFLISAQAANGSWSRYGEASAISDTVAVLHSLHSLGTTTAGETYTKGIGWLGSQFPDSTLLASQKFWMLAESGEDVSYSFDAIVQRSNDDGGFGYSSKYRSDVSTTASVLEAITASNYTGYGDNPDFIETSAIIFLLNNQNSNGGWGEFTEDESRVLQTTSALGALFPYRDAILHGASGDIAVKEYVEKGLNYLKNIQGTDGAWNQDVSDTALAYEMLHRYGIVLAAEDKAFEYLKSAQEPDGGFGGGSPYVTAQALMALSYRLFDKRPDLVITDITTSSALVNYTPVTFVVTLKNIGGSAISDGRLYNFVGDYNWDPAGFDLRALGMNLAPGDALKVTLNFPVTDQFLGDMNFKFYVEGDGESNYENNWFSKIFRFAGEPSGKPALPVYFIANKYDISGYPALNIRWPMRDDPNRSMYVILYKKKSAQAWKFFGVQNSWDGAFLYPFEEGVTYEVTAGVLHQDGSTITHFSDNPVDITMSSNPLSYTGGVSGKMTLNEKEFPDALTYGYGVSGTTNSDGDISYHNVSNGTTAAWAYYKRYDHIVTKFSISTGATTSGVRLFTRLADDTQPPLVTFFEILEESDHMIENGRNVELGFWAADDKELEEAELSYFNPQTNAWTHIKSIKNIPFNNLMFAGTPWAVGKELLGPGYKVRV
ncbi:MAG TPA: prenyltransferase/squalene oxidase repeat-containing protein, partial [Candidatus Paceibacterota bacterium]